MRTTLVLNDELLGEAKKRAADRRSSLSAIVNEALRVAFKGEPASREAREAYQMPTYRPSGAKRARTSPRELFDLQAAEDVDAYRP